MTNINGVVELEDENKRLKEALIASEQFRRAYREGKLKMYAEGGVVQEAAMRLLPCDEGPLMREVRALLPGTRNY